MSDTIPTADRPDEAAPEEVGADGRSPLRTALRSILGMRSIVSARSEIEDVLAHDEAGGAAFSPEERAMLRAILKLGGMRVDDVMVPRANIEAIEQDATLAQALADFREAGHSRMPVYRDTLDDPVGMVHIKDVMAWITDRAVGKKPAEDGGGEELSLDLRAVDFNQPLSRTGLVRPLLFVPPSMPARMLLERMQASRTQIALVIDEYGGTDGIVSLEDLVEIIVGEIEDEHDLDEEPTVVKTAEGQFVADARTPIEDAQKIIGGRFRAPEGENVETIGGLVFAATGRIPVRGEIVYPVEGFEFEILDADPRRIKRVRIRERRKLKPTARARAKATPRDPGESPQEQAAE